MSHASLPEHAPHLVIGAGLAGLSTAWHDPQAVVLEALGQVGGKSSTEHRDGFTFDVTGHWLHLRDPAMRALVEGVCPPEHFVEIERVSRIYAYGAYTEYPFQANLFGQPPAVIHECLMGAIEASRARPDVVPVEAEPENFADWIRFYFGEGIARHFMLPYNQRLWGVPAETITSRWCQRFVPRPRLSEIVAGAVGANRQSMGYNARFLYPRQGGIQSVSEHLADAVGRERLFLKSPVKVVDAHQRRVFLADGRSVAYDHLISTAPLPELIDRLLDVPAEVRAARQRLKATEVVYLNVGLKTPVQKPDHWVYVPEARFPFYRVGSFSNALPSMAPPGCGSLYVELTDREATPDLPTIIAGLVELGLVARPEDVLFADVRRIPYAYVVYNFDYHQSRAVVMSYLDSLGIQSIGRYGDWNYSSMEDALLAGKAAVARLGGLA